jgi:hypothetical protein
MPWVRAWSVDDVAKHVDTLPLARKNAHARDHNVAFRDADHVYFVKVRRVRTVAFVPSRSSD